MKYLSVGLMVSWACLAMQVFYSSGQEFITFGQSGSGTGTISIANAIDDSGEVAVGAVVVDGNFSGFLWTEGTGLQVLAGTRSALGVSGNGETVVGDGQSDSMDFLEPFFWDSSDGVQYLGVPPGEIEDRYTYASMASSDGSFLVGTTSLGGESKAFRYNGTQGFQILSGTTPALSDSASGISADGAIVVGYDSESEKAFRWTSATGKALIEGVIPSDQTNATDVSANGEVVVGTVNAQSSFLWTEGDGISVLGPSLTPGAFSIAPLFSYALGVTEAGKAVVGSANGTEAYVWTERFGMESLELVLRNRFGMNEAFTGWRLDEATDISPDGHYIVGNGTNPAGRTQGWLVRLDSPIFAPEPSSLFLIALSLPMIFEGHRRLPCSRRERRAHVKDCS